MDVFHRLSDDWVLFAAVFALVFVGEGIVHVLKYPRLITQWKARVRRLMQGKVNDMLQDAQDDYEDNVVAELVTDAIVEAFLANRIRKHRMSYYFRQFGEALGIRDLMPGGSLPKKTAEKLKNAIRRRIAAMRAEGPARLPDIVVLYNEDGTAAHPFAKVASKKYTNKLEEIWDRQRIRKEERRMHTM